MKETNDWFEFAEEDVTLAKISLREEIYNQACFHSQQGSEKILKGFLKTRNSVIPKTHSLNDLLSLCADIDASFEELRERCSALDNYYIPTRYPDALIGMTPDGLPNKTDAEKAVSYLEQIKLFVKEKI